MVLNNHYINTVNLLYKEHTGNKNFTYKNDIIFFMCYLYLKNYSLLLLLINFYFLKKKVNEIKFKIIY